MPANMRDYILALVRIPRLALAAFGIVLIAKIAAAALIKWHDHETAFDAAVKLLVHYPESIAGIGAFFAVILFLLCLTLIIEPSKLGHHTRRLILIPSLHIVEHMVSLTIGVFVAWALIDCFTVGIPFGSVIQMIGAIGLGVLVLGALAAICNFGAEFMERDFDSVVERLGSYRFAILACIGIGLVGSLYFDFVYQYKPSLPSH